jgi:hypothetical protein
MHLQILKERPSVLQVRPPQRVHNYLFLEAFAILCSPVWQVYVFYVCVCLYIKYILIGL